MRKKMDEKLIFDLRGYFIALVPKCHMNFMKFAQSECVKYLENYEDNEHKHIENSIYTLNALIEYLSTGKKESSYRLARPMLENLAFGNNIELTENNYNKFLLQIGIVLSENYKQALNIVTTLEKSVEVYPVDEKLRTDILSWVYLNFLENAFYDLRFNIDSKEEQLQVEKLIKEIVTKVKKVI